MAMAKYRKDGTLYLFLAFLVMGLLFWSSSQTYEQQSQIGLLEVLLKKQPFHEALSSIQFMYAGEEVSVAHSGYFKFVEFFIRKGAHFFTYFLLGSFLFLGLTPRVKGIWITTVISWLSATGYAGLDEFHQQLTGGRTPLFEDVMLDSMGALTGIVICLVVLYIKKSRK